MALVGAVLAVMMLARLATQQQLQLTRSQQEYQQVAAVSAQPGVDAPDRMQRIRCRGLASFFPTAAAIAYLRRQACF